MLSTNTSRRRRNPAPARPPRRDRRSRPIAGRWNDAQRRALAAARRLRRLARPRSSACRHAGRCRGRIARALPSTAALPAPSNVFDPTDVLRQYTPRDAPGARRARRSAAIEQSLREHERRLRRCRMQMWWLDRMLDTPAPLQEKMTLFCHGHFTQPPCKRASRATLTYRRTTLPQLRARESARADARGFARSGDADAISTTRANVEAHPNENYARELMELFTLGIGNYTEKDVRESARAFTGWRSTALHGHVSLQPAPARRRQQDVPRPDRQLQRRRHRQHHLRAAAARPLVCRQAAELLRLQRSRAGAGRRGRRAAAQERLRTCSR